jgi:hypothetical protein
MENITINDLTKMIEDLTWEYRCHLKSLTQDELVEEYFLINLKLDEL